MSEKWGYHRGPWSASQRWRWRRSLFRSAKDRVTWDGETVESRRAGALEYLRRALAIHRPVSIKTKDVNTMINDKLPALHQPLVDLIRTIAPDVKVEMRTTTEDVVTVDCSFCGRSVDLRHDADGDWWARGMTLNTERDLVEHLCWLVDAPRMAGPADVVEMRTAIQDSDRPELRALWEHCNAALNRKDSAAILACSRALPNNDWRKHGIAETRAESATTLRAEPLPNGDVVYSMTSAEAAAKAELLVEMPVLPPGCTLSKTGPEPWPWEVRGLDGKLVGAGRSPLDAAGNAWTVFGAFMSRDDYEALLNVPGQGLSRRVRELTRERDLAHSKAKRLRALAESRAAETMPLLDQDLAQTSDLPL